MTEQKLPHFRTPEAVAPELGITPTELRRYCRISTEHCTRLSRHKIMLTEENIDTIKAYIKRMQAEPVTDPKTGKIDPFA